LSTAAPTPARIRAAAAQWVAEVADRGRSLEELLAGDTDEGSARGLKRSLCYGTLRWHFRLRAILSQLADRPPDKLAPTLRALLEVGLYQLLSGEVAEHAAVAETVGAARELGHARAAGFVNAVLRRFQRERSEILAKVDADIATRTAHPRWLALAIARDWPSAAQAILDANNAHPPLWLRVNRMRAGLDEEQHALEAAGFRCHRASIAPDALKIEPAADVRSLPGFAQGRVSVQDAAAQLAIELLAPRAGERILDACAAPGGKTCHMLERTAGAVVVTAVDASPARLERVRANLDRLGLAATLVAGDVLRPDAWWDGRPFDRILLDVPCSATGVIRRHPDIKLLRRPGDLRPLARRQRAMLEALWPLLKPGGRLLYTSCSVLHIENREVVGGFLEATPAASEATPEAVAGWPERGNMTGPGHQRLPGEADMDGFYYACLDKQD
jgi:16S rRNA (cytosine967-C5)-methyltransferase